MRGKVLEIGLISGDDGNRYNFEPSDVANLGKRTLENLTGYFVAFVISGTLCLFVIGYILVPAVYIIMCIHIYKSAKLQE